MTSGKFSPKRFKAEQDASSEIMAAQEAAFNDFCDQQGWVVGRKHVCSGCDKRSANKKVFVECAGPCMGARKPTYCDRACQKSMSPTYYSKAFIDRATGLEKILDSLYPYRGPR
jgi:hypothetical protein